jgi:thermitase
MKLFPFIGLLLLPLMASSTTLRLEGDRAWLKTEGAPLPKVLQLFEQCGVDVLIDPSLGLGRVFGDWENTRVDRLIEQLVSPNSYLLEWERLDTPLGELYQVASIKIYSDGNLSAAKRLSKKERVLDVVEGTNGVSYIRGEIMVGFSEGSDIDDLKALLRKLGGTVIEVIDPPGLYRIKLTEEMSVEEAMEIALAHEGVEGAEPNLAFPTLDNQIIPLNGGGQGINLHLQPGETAVAVFDSGLDPQYANLSYIRGAYNAIDPSAEMTDPSGHGTLVALVASGAITPLGAEESGQGVPILAVRVFDENGYTSSDTIMRAIEYAINSDVGIINLSFGTYEDVGFIEDAVNYAAQQGIKVIVAAGNDGLNKSVNPAANPSTVSVGAKNPDGTIADYSNTGDTVTGYEYGTVVLDGEQHRGTSFASPRIAHKYATQK